MKVTLKQVFSIVDGRVATNIVDVCNMLSYVFDMQIGEHNINTALKLIRNRKPKWYQQAKELLDSIKIKYSTNELIELIEIFDNNYSEHMITLEKIKSDIEIFLSLMAH